MRSPSALRALISTRNKGAILWGHGHLFHFEWQVLCARSPRHLPAAAAFGWTQLKRFGQDDPDSKAGERHIFKNATKPFDT